MGIKNLNGFLHKLVKQHQVDQLKILLRQLMTTLPADHAFSQFITTNVLPLKEKEDMLGQLHTIAESFRSHNTREANEFIRYFQVELPMIVSVDPLFKVKPLSTFRGCRIAIDANNWMFTHMAVAHKRNIEVTDILLRAVDRKNTLKLWLERLVDELVTYLTSGVTPVFVFDGEYPEEKKETKEKRSKDKQAVRSRIEELRRELAELDILDRSQAKITEFKKLLSQDTYITREEITLLQTTLTKLGIPWLQAKGEGEKLCSMLAIEGRVSAVFSTDTDNLTYGCPCLITSFERPTQEGPMVTIIETDEVLDFIDMSYNSFIDLCIMAGCDYNENIRNLGVGKAYKLLKQHGTIEKVLPHIKGDPSCLKYEVCRRLFTYVPSNELIANPETSSLDVKQPVRWSEATEGLSGPSLGKLYRAYDHVSPVRDKEMRMPGCPRLRILS